MISLQRQDKSKLSLVKGRYSGQYKETERRKREGEGDERGRAGIAYCPQDEINIITGYNIILEYMYTYYISVWRGMASLLFGPCTEKNCKSFF